MANLEPIPFNDLSRSIKPLRNQIDSAIKEVLDSGWLVLGPQHEALETELASFLGVKYAINVANGTDALELALAAVGVGAGDIVLTVANAGAYSTTATLLLGATPAFVDVDPVTLLMSSATLEESLISLDSKPSALVVTHLYGAMAPMDDIIKIAKREGIPVIEDCAQSMGAELGGKLGGSFGDVATTSFYPTKNLGALGDGGAVFTNNHEIANKVRYMRQYGWESKYRINHSHGKNSRLDEIQAAILRVKLPYLMTSNAQRLAIHSEYESSEFRRGKWVNNSSPMFNGHLAVLTMDSPQLFREYFSQFGISTEIHYPIPDHQQQIPALKTIPYHLPVTEWASNHIVSVPMFPELSKEEVSRIVMALGNY